MARGECPVQPERLEHARTCQHCQRLVADFREALAEGAAADQPVPTRQKVFRFPQIAALAAAASVLIAVGIGIFFSIREQPRLPILAGAEVGLQSQIESGMVAKSGQRFTSGDAIMFQIELCREGYVMLINLDPSGQVVAVPPEPSSTALSQPISKGTTKLGPYRLDNTTGLETFFIVAVEKEPADIQGKIVQLQKKHDQTSDVEALAEQIRSWPAEVKVISFEHSPPK